MEKKKRISLLLALILIMQILLPTISLVTNQVIAAGEDLVTLTFKDENLFNALKEILADIVSESSGPDAKGNYTIKMTQANIDSVTVLRLSEKQINNIEGIEGFKNLNNLSLDGNKIANIDSLSNLINLAYLHLSNNQITNIESLSNLTNLQHLDLGSNQITNINNLSNLTNLQILYLSENEITDISVIQNFTKLRILHVGSNNISSFGEGQDEDEFPIMGDDGIVILNDIFPETLEELYLNDNKIEDIHNFVNLKNLKKLKLQNNCIEDISPIENLDNITELILNNQTIVKKANNKVNNMELPNIFKDAQKETSKVYSADGVLTNKGQITQSKLNYDKNNIGLISVSIAGGLAKGSTLFVVDSDEKINEILNDEIKIYNKNDLIDIQTMNNVAKVDLSKEKIILQNDINLGNEEWTPIGNADKSFKGTFDGNEYKITGLYINSTNNYQGFIGRSEGVIKNLTVEGNVKSTGVYVGGICGHASPNALIVNCQSNVKVEGKQYVGGIAGICFGKTENCKNTGDVSGTSDDVGGITGYGNSNVIQNCYNTGNISGENGIGGIIGYVANEELIKNCYSRGTVTGNEKLGALVGLNNGGTITNSYYLNTCTVKAINNQDDEANNVIGLSDSDMKKEAFVTALNEGEESGSWKAGNYYNNYPMLIWESYKELTGIEIQKQPTVINYLEGQNFNPEGMKVVAKYNDGTSKDVTNDISVLGGNNLKAGTTEITIEYTEGDVTKTTTQNITVAAKELTGIEITQAPVKTQYIEGQTFDRSGMEVTAYYNNGTSKVVTNYLIPDESNLTPNRITVTISYRENGITKEAKQKIIVTHDFEEIREEATCTEKGYTKQRCKVCGLEIMQAEIEALGHNYEDVVTEPTCTEGGYTTHTCTRCNDTYVDDEVAALGHNYEDVVTEPTCTEGGYTTHTCTRCNDTYIDDEEAALGHDYENGVCKRCGAQKPIIEVTSEKYIIDDTYNYIKNIEPKTTVQELIQALTTNATEIKLYKGNKELSMTDKVGTNTKVYLKNAYGERTLTIIVKGDVDGDGEANFWDVIAINKHRLGIQTLGDAEIVAGDLDRNSLVDFWDMITINKFRLGILKNI